MIEIDIGDEIKPLSNDPSAIPAEQTLAQRCAAIDLLVVDVDGVLTDGSIVYADNGAELKTFHVRDGSGLKLWQKAGKQAAIITGRTSRVVEIRAAELGIAPVFQGVASKLAALRQLLSIGWQPEQVCFVGDDLPDLPVMRQCGLAVAVADACAEAVADAHYMTRALGGRGAVREVIELILRCQGRWQGLVEAIRGSSL